MIGPGEKEPIKPWCVFIVDDSPEDRAEVRRMLLNGSERRLRFVEHETAHAAISAMRGAAMLPDCVVLDYYLPDMEAPEVLSALRGLDGITVCPFVVLTGGTSRGDGKRVLRAGAQDYIGKDWTSPQGLSRAIENACESWAMTREIFERSEALRLANARDSFRILFADSIQNVTDEHELKRVATQLLGLHMRASRLIYAELFDDERVVIESGYVDGVQQIDGVYRLADYGPALLAKLHAGESVSVSDVRQDSAYSASQRQAYARLDIVSSLGIPIIRNGRLVATLGVHQSSARGWTADETSFAREIAERTWAAVEQARLESKLLASQAQLAQIVAITPSFSAVLRGAEHVIELANQAFYDLVHHGSEILGLTFVAAFPEYGDQIFQELLDTVYRTGEKFEARGMRIVAQHGGAAVELFLDFDYLPLRAADGRTSGIFMHGVDRTAEVRTTQTLAQRERELRSVTENTPDGLARFDSEFRHLFANSVIEQHVGKQVAEIIGKTSRELGVPAVLCDQWEEAIQHVFDHKSPSALDFLLDTPNDGLRQFASRVVPEFDGGGVVVSALAVTHDITEQKGAEDSLRQSESRFEVAIKNTRIVVYTTDNDLRYTWIRNPHPAFDPANLLGRRDDELLPPEKAEPLIRLKQAVLDSGVGARGEFAVELGGTLVHYDVTVEPLRAVNGSVEGVTVAAIEITDRKQIEEALREADRRKDAFLATMAHELRNPLAALRNGLELFKRSSTADVAPRIVPMMERQLSQLVRLIDDLMDVSRITTGKLVLKRERISVQEIVAVTLETARPFIDAAGHSLSIDWPDEPVWLHADPIRLSQVFGNLLTNSAKYMRAGGQIKLSARQLGESVVITVQDTGMGIPADLLGTVFDMFTQVKRTLDRSQGGLGIGLSLVKTLVELHGGEVAVTSGGIELGSTFTVTLPTDPLLDSPKTPPVARRLAT